MTWNYRIIRFVGPCGDPWQAIHEVFYDEADKPNGYSELASGVISIGEDGEGIGLRAVLAMMAEALEKPVLIERDFESVSDDAPGERPAPGIGER